MYRKCVPLDYLIVHALIHNLQVFDDLTLNNNNILYYLFHLFALKYTHTYTEVI